MSDFKELIATFGASELGQAALTQVEEFLQNVLKEPGTALGGLVGDKINFRRFKNLAYAVCEARRLLRELGLTERDVPLKIIHPLLEGASLEDEPDMRAIWSNLMANTADPRCVTPIGAMFPDILRDLGAREVRFLDALYADAEKRADGGFFKNVSQQRYTRMNLWDFYKGLPLAPTNREREEEQNEFWLMLDIIRRQGVLREVYIDNQTGQASYQFLIKDYHVSDLGAAFILACRPPAK